MIRQWISYAETDWQACQILNRLIPAQKAFAFARKLQGTPGCTVSVC